jgi:predicted nucleotidyltransferase
MRTLDDIDLRPGDRAAIDEAARVIRCHAAIEQIIVFGSKARGDDDDESDIDLLVLTSHSLARSERHAIVDALFPIQLSHGVVLSPIFVAIEDWRSGPISVLPIRAEVDDHGVAA